MSGKEELDKGRGGLSREGAVGGPDGRMLPANEFGGSHGVADEGAGSSTGTGESGGEDR